MSPTKTEKSFDCVAFKHKVLAEIYEETKGMTHAEQIAYFNRCAEEGPLGEWWKKMKAASARRRAESARNSHVD